MLDVCMEHCHCTVIVMFIVLTSIALVNRQRGNMQRSLELFQEAMQLNPNNIENAKQVARSLYAVIHTQYPHTPSTITL